MTIHKLQNYIKFPLLTNVLSNQKESEENGTIISVIHKNIISQEFSSPAKLINTRVSKDVIQILNLKKSIVNIV